jgi:hypothetical protein
MESNLGAQSPRQPVAWGTPRTLPARYLKPFWGRATVLGVLILGVTGLQIVGGFVDAVQTGQNRLRCSDLRCCVWAQPCFAACWPWLPPT